MTLNKNISSQRNNSTVMVETRRSRALASSSSPQPTVTGKKMHKKPKSIIPNTRRVCPPLDNSAFAVSVYHDVQGSHMDDSTRDELDKLTYTAATNVLDVLTTYNKTQGIIVFRQPNNRFKLYDLSTLSCKNDIRERLQTALLKLQRNKSMTAVLLQMSLSDGKSAIEERARAVEGIVAHKHSMMYVCSDELMAEIHCIPFHVLVG